MTTRRRFLMIAAAAMATGTAARAAPFVWQGAALGAVTVQNIRLQTSDFLVCRGIGLDEGEFAGFAEHVKQSLGGDDRTTRDSCDDGRAP